MTATLLARVPGAAPTLPPEVDLRTEGRGRLAVRRLLAVLGTAVILVVLTGHPASARFADSVTLASPTVGTHTVVAPAQVEAKPICTTTVDPTTGASTTVMTLKIEWWQSTSPRVTGYAITAYPTGGTAYELMRTGPTDETYVVADQGLIASQPRFTVTTLTAYGWTKTSSMTAVPRC
jgi:hypothetical protein